MMFSDEIMLNLKGQSLILIFDIFSIFLLVHLALVHLESAGNMIFCSSSLSILMFSV